MIETTAKMEGGEVAQQLRGPDAHSEGPGSVASTARSLTVAWNSAPGERMPPPGLHRHYMYLLLYTYVSVCVYTYIHTRAHKLTQILYICTQAHTHNIKKSFYKTEIMYKTY